MLNLKFKAYQSKKNKRLHDLIDTAGHIWNHCIALHKRHYRIYGKYIQLPKLQKHIAKLRNKNQKWKTLKAQSVQEVCERVDAAYSKFFKKTASRPPKFRKIKEYNSFVVKKTGFKVQHNRLTIHRFGEFKFSKSREYANIQRVVVKRDTSGDIWFYLICDMKPKPLNRTGNAAVGLDFGLKTFLTCSNGIAIVSPEFFKQGQVKLKKYQQKLNRKVKGSKNRKKILCKVSVINAAISNKRADFQWKLAHRLCTQNKFISIEDLNLKGMRKLWGRKISDLAFFSFTVKLQQVGSRYGTIIQKIGRFYPSSKTCGCGYVNKDLQLEDRTWVCQSCGTKNQRDLLASKNILSEGIRLYRSENKTDLSAFHA